jgi:hypothetical protein
MIFWNRLIICLDLFHLNLASESGDATFARLIDFLKTNGIGRCNICIGLLIFFGTVGASSSRCPLGLGLSLGSLGLKAPQGF